MSSKDTTNWNKLEMGIPLCDDEPIRLSWETGLDNYACFDNHGITWAKLDLSKGQGYFMTFDVMTEKMTPAYEHGDGRYRWNSCLSIAVEWPWPRTSTRFVNMWWLYQVHPFAADRQRSWGPTINLSFWEAYRA